MATSLTQKYGPWALITGASDGIGKSMAVDLAQRGLHVVIVARNGAALNALKTDLEGRFHVNVRTLPLDLSQPTAQHELLSSTADLDIGLFVAAAGFGTSGDFIQNSIDMELNMIDLNCRAVVEQTHAFAHRFKQRGKGAIVLFSSLFAFQGVPGSSTYAATKAFIQNFGEGLHIELKPHGIDVLIAAPGPVTTGFGSRADMKYRFGEKASTVSRAIISAIGKTTTLRPGPIAKILECALWATFSRKIRSLILGQIIRDMTQHRKNSTTRTP